MDRHGYPEKKDLLALRAFGVLDNQTFEREADIILSLFESTGVGSGRITKFGRKIRLYLHTGGWSGCEEMISAINKIWWSMYWKESTVGGHYIFEGRRDKNRGER